MQYLCEAGLVNAGQTADPCPLPCEILKIKGAVSFSARAGAFYFSPET